MILLLGSLADAGSPPLTPCQASVLLQDLEADDFPTAVPDNAQPLLVVLKHGLRDLVLEALNAQQARTPSTDDATNYVRSRLGLDPCSPKQYRDPYGEYGHIEAIELHAVPHRRDLVTLTTTISVPCGGHDTSLYLLQRRAKRWSVVLTQASDDYPDISGALSDFEYLVLQPKRTDDLAVVTANVNPWCSSCWQSLRVNVYVLSPTISGVRQTQLADEFFFACGGYTLVAADSGFQVTFINLGEDASLVQRTVQYRVDAQGSVTPEFGMSRRADR
jgi:hypothetical protein